MARDAKNDSLAAPPAPFRQISPYTIELTEGGGRLALFGLPFFLVGVAMALNLMGVLPTKAEPGSSSFALAVASLVFAAVGAVMVFGRRWLTVDTSRGLVVRSYGLLVALHTQERPLNEFNAVVLAYDPGDSDRAETYPLRLRSTTGKDFAVSTPAKFGESRTLAEYLSAFLRLPLADSTTDHETIVAPERVGQTLRERLVAGRELPQPARPLKMRCQVNESVGNIVIVIPGGGGWLAGVFSIVFPLVVLFVVIPALLRFFTRISGSQIVYFSVLLLLVVAFVLPTIVVSVNLMVGSKRKKMKVTASPAGLEIEKRSSWRTQTTTVPATDLLDLDCSTAVAALKSARSSSRRLSEAPNPSALRLAEILKRWIPSRGIIVKSNQELITLAEGLPAAELQYLSWLLRRALVGKQS